MSQVGAVPEAAPAAAAWRCRWCRSAGGAVLLDLGEQPAASSFPRVTDPVPDPVAPLRLVRCAACELLQLEAGLPVLEDLPAVEPVAMTRHGAQAVRDLVAAGLLRAGESFASFASPHGSSWDEHLLRAGLHRAPTGAADVVVDVFGLMHDEDQAAGLDARLAALAPGGVLVLQVHPFGVDVAQGAWHAVRHGHYAYYTVAWLVSAMEGRGLGVVRLTSHPLQGGTVLLVARAGAGTAAAVREVVDRERAAGAAAPERIRELDAQVGRSAARLAGYVADCRALGLTVAGYAASSGAPALLARAGIGPDEVVAVGDASAAKQGRALPVSRLPVVTPDALVALRPDRVLLFVPGLLDEVRGTLPGVEAAGGRWVVVDPEPREVPAGRGASQASARGAAS